MSFQSLVWHKFINGYIVENEDLENEKLKTNNQILINVKQIETIQCIKKQPNCIHQITMNSGDKFNVWIDPPLSKDTIKL